jgi:uncharacterized protein (DUF58 family)
MNFEDLLRKVQKVKLKGKHLSQHQIAGAYQSHFRGKGITFDRIRKYQYGDDIRAIDWNVTARYNDSFVKVFTEEREQALILLIDVSASGNFGSTQKTKKEVLAEVSACLAFAALQNNDRVGAVFFSNKIEKYIPAGRGKNHVLALIRTLLEFEPVGCLTDISQGLRFVVNVLKKKCNVFVISDFLDQQYEEWMPPAARKHYLTAIRIADPLEKDLPDVGWLPLQNAESGQVQWLNASSMKIRESYKKEAAARVTKFEQVLTKSKAKYLHLSTNEDCALSLFHFFTTH